MSSGLKDKEAGMSASPIEVVGQWLQNLLDPEVVNRVVAPDATYVSLNTEDGELNKIMPWAGTSHGPQAFLDNLGAMFSRWENQEFNVTTMFASDENVAVFGDFRYKSNSLGKVVSSPFSILVKVVDGKVTCLQFLEGQLRHRPKLPQGRFVDRPDRGRRRAVRGRSFAMSRFRQRQVRGRADVSAQRRCPAGTTRVENQGNPGLERLAAAQRWACP